MSDLNKNFKDVYSPLLSDLKKELEKIVTSLTGIPELFFPIYGKNYEYVKHKIAFVGMETRGYGSLEDMRRHLDLAEDLTDILFRIEDEFDDLEFTKWTNNFGKSFWDYILQFLAAYYQIDDWKDLKNQKNKYILSSFLWGNSSALERYKITAQQKGADYSLWENIKSISRKFDSLELLIRAAKPDIVIILNWELDKEYLQMKDMTLSEPESIDDHLKYYHVKETNTHVIHHAHPNWINREVGYERSIANLIETINTKLGTTSKNDMFTIKENHDYASMVYKREYILALADFLFKNKKVMSGYELVQHLNRNDILTSYGTHYMYGRGIYSLIRSVWRYYQDEVGDTGKARMVAESFVKENGEFAYQ